MGMEDAPPVSEAERILAPLAPELAAPVHSFLHGGMAGRLRPCDTPATAMFKVRLLTDALESAHMVRRDHHHIAVLAAALRLQTVVLYEMLRALHGANAGSG